MATSERIERLKAAAAGDDGASAERAVDGGASSGLDPEARDVLDDLRDVDVNETPPVELLTRVQEWQERLGDGE